MSLPALANPSAPSASPGMLRAARLMRELGPSASGVWAELSTEEADQLGAIMSMQGSAQTGDTVPAESQALVSALREGSKPDQTTPAASLWSRLSSLDPAVLARNIEHENPQVIAVILSRLDPDTAAQTVRALPRGAATEALRRLLHLGWVRAPALKVIETALKDLVTTGPARTRSDGHEAVARIFDQMDPRAEQALIASLEQKEPGSQARVRALMFTFDDLSTLNPAAIQTILSRVDRAVLATALKGAKPATRDVFLQNMTQRAGSLLVSDIEALGPTRRSEVEAARQEITGIARSLARRGDILAANDEEDELIE
ncbi:flagellar motor switch protein FliG [Henriciella aquimarina]|uniref:flagellar motor switch protein FliG n=1 Tax=Henriciella aquimarina TaxID=545261 RepID=UPI000A06728D|nr:FliG C-terminal domain-containing protein [Henriciella aquimarina]